MKLFQELDLKFEVRQEKNETPFFLPNSISFDMMELMRKHNVKFKHYSMLRLWKQQVPDEYKLTPGALEAKMIPYMQAGCQDAESPVLIVSHCNADDLFETARQFFGPTINENYRLFKEQQQHSLHCILNENLDDMLGSNDAAHHRRLIKNGKTTLLSR